MRLSWDEYRRRARAFSDEWRDAHYEKGETQSFYNDFFDIFQVKRRTVATYERRVRLLNNKHGFMDLFWPRVLLVEQKSARLDLDRAEVQAFDYIDGLPLAEQPRHVLTCDFQQWRLLDLETNHEVRFALADLHLHLEAFAFILGRQHSFETQAAVTMKAAELMGHLHEALAQSNYKGHDLEQLLVRLLFCMFADRTGIFQPIGIFLQLLQNDTREDGSDTGRALAELFDVLDTPEAERQAGLPGELNAFPYVNGGLFRGRLRTPVFDRTMRALLVNACEHDWSAVSPAIFGSLFQSVMSPNKRRRIGAHYTSEGNILKVIGPLFLDDLKAELERLTARRSGREAALIEFQHKLARLTFLDPACGCGNFLVIAYRELRRVELACLRALYPDQRIDAVLLSRVTVDQFYGIEIEEFPARIAEVAMWMTDHLANNEFNVAFHGNSARIPLTDSAHIRHADALETDWSSVVPPGRLDFIMGNPPFVGAKFQSAEQRTQVRRIAGLGGSGGTLDLVAAWFVKAGQYVNGTGQGSGTPGQARGDDDLDQPPFLVTPGLPPHTVTPGLTPPTVTPGLTRGPASSSANRRIRIAFVATNSITQGEQVAQLWPILFDRFGLEIAFAHRTFAWGSEARGGAHVHVVVIGLTHREAEPAEKRLFSYPDIKGAPVETRHAALTAYLFDARGVTNRHLVVREEGRPINGASKVVIGSKPIDGGRYIFDASERAAFIAVEPDAAAYLHPYVGSEEFINGGQRWILNLGEAEPDALARMTQVRRRIAEVREIRCRSLSAGTRALGAYPTKYHVTVVPSGQFMVIPKVSSERREYVPIGWLDPPTIPSDLVFVLADTTPWQFAILTSRAHMAWLAHIGGRLESRFRYSIGLVYNTFRWPDATPAQRARVEALAQGVLDARAAHPTASLADLYDPDTMPPDLRRAHAALDLAVDRLYRREPFSSDRDRVEHLFGRYEALVNPLATAGVKANRRVARRRATP